MPPHVSTRSGRRLLSIPQVVFPLLGPARRGARHRAVAPAKARSPSAVCYPHRRRIGPPTTCPSARAPGRSRECLRTRSSSSESPEALYDEPPSRLLFNQTLVWLKARLMYHQADAASTRRGVGIVLSGLALLLDGGRRRRRCCRRACTSKFVSHQVRERNPPAEREAAVVATLRGRERGTTRAFAPRPKSGSSPHRQNDLGSPSCSAMALRAISLVIGPICHRRASRQ